MTALAWAGLGVLAGVLVAVVAWWVDRRPCPIGELARDAYARDLRAQRLAAAAPEAPADPPPTEDEVDRWDRDTRQWKAELEQDAERRRALNQAKRQAAHTVGLRARILQAGVLLEMPFEYEGERVQ